MLNIQNKLNQITSTKDTTSQSLVLFVLGVILRCLLDVYVQLDQRNILQADLKEAIQSFQY